MSALDKVYRKINSLWSNDNSKAIVLREIAQGVPNPKWDDLRVAASTVNVLGANAPTNRVFRTTDSSFSGFSIGKNTNAQQVGSLLTGADVNLDGASNYSISFWVVGDGFTTIQELLDIGGFNIVWRPDDEIRVSGFGSGFIEGPIIKGQKTHIVFTANHGTGDVMLYLNNALVDSTNSPSFTTRATDTLRLLVSDEYRGHIDNLTFYSSVLNLTEINNLYNGGDGITITGAEPNLLAGYPMNEGMGLIANEINGGPVLTLVEDDWGDGLVTSNSSVGTILKTFSPDVPQEVFFEVQIPHGWKLGTNIKPHVHFIPASDIGSDKVIWGLEYVIAPPGGKFADNTTIIRTDGVPNIGGNEGEHTIDSFPDEIDMQGQNISTMLICRLFRDATNVEDTYDGEVHFLEFDIHILLDSDGSQQEFIKETDTV